MTTASHLDHRGLAAGAVTFALARQAAPAAPAAPTDNAAALAAAIALNAAELAAERPEWAPQLAAMYGAPPAEVRSHLHESGADRTATLAALTRTIHRQTHRPTHQATSPAPTRRAATRRARRAARPRTGATRSGNDPPPPHPPVQHSAPGGYPGATVRSSERPVPNGRAYPQLVAHARTR
jgi:hypothetical protein